MFTKKKNLRIKVLFIFIVLVFLAVILKIIYVQVFSYNKLHKLADNLWSKELPITAERGKILDRNGKVLADNLTTTSLYVIPTRIKDKETVAKKISEILNVDYKKIYDHLNKNVSIERIHPEGRRLDSDKADKINSLNIEGVYLVKESKRNYPNGNLLSHVLGYVGIDNQGLSGIELLYDKYLTGEDGAIKYYSDAKGNNLDINEEYIKSTDGMDIMLTVDLDIQKSVERELDNIVSMFTPDNAYAIAMDPNTGEVLAMASRPNFDPNNYKDYDTETLNRNLPIWKTYEPGSTFKIVTTASAVEEHVVDLDNDTFYDSGSVTVTGAKIRCWKSGGHGHQTFMQVFQNSCNPGFVELGFRLGKEKLFSYINRFGFGDKTGIDLNGESKGILFPLENVKDLELATTAFGQGVAVTAIQQVNAVSSIVNGGNLNKPYILRSILDNETNNIILENKTTFIRKTISEETSATMRRALENVVALGGGKKAYIDGYRIGGKTGTAQKQENGRYLENNYIMSFMSVLPANNPKVVLYLAIDNPKKTALLSSYTTTPFVRSILEDIIKIIDLPKQDNQTEKEYEWNDRKYKEVENVVGKTIKEAKTILKDFNIEIVGNGEFIKEQSVTPGERYFIGGTIKLLTT